MRPTAPVRDEGGFSLIEVLVAIGIFSVVSAAIYAVTFSGVSGSQVAEDVSRVSEEARAGFNRMIRDTREGQNLISTTATRFVVETDFNDDGLFENPNPDNDFERLTFDFADGEITLNGETLIDGVEAIPGRDVFAYSSNLLEYDWDGDGITSCVELSEAPSHGVVGIGDNDDICDEAEHDFLSNIDFAFRVRVGDSVSNLFAQAQMRNQR